MRRRDKLRTSIQSEPNTSTSAPGAPPDDPSDPGERARAVTWQERHGATVLGAVLSILFALVLTIQAAC